MAYFNPSTEQMTALERYVQAAAADETANDETAATLQYLWDMVRQNGASAEDKSAAFAKLQALVNREQEYARIMTKYLEERLSIRDPQACKYFLILFTLVLTAIVIGTVFAKTFIN